MAANNYPKDLYIPPDAMQICLDMFEGPLDLLLYLIRNQNLDILAIPIASITEQYIQYINAMQILNIDLASEYLLMAAMLLEIKSRMLLPKKNSDVGLDNQEEIDPRQDLIKRLTEYEQIKQAAIKINDLPQANRDYLWLDILIDTANKTPPKVNVVDLQKAWHNILLKSMYARHSHQITRQELSVREYMGHILRYLSINTRTTFYKLFNVNLGIAHVVVNFIAILELTKDGLVEILQDKSNEIIVALCGNTDES